MNKIIISIEVIINLYFLILKFIIICTERDRDVMKWRSQKITDNKNIY